MAQLKKSKLNNLVLQFQPCHNLMEEFIENDPLRKPLAIYVHIPYCKWKCFYCSIEVQLSSGQQEFDQYINAILAEIQYYKQFFKTRNIRCIHFGGGTPSIMSEKQIESILNSFCHIVDDWENLEIVFESHPLTMSTSKLNLLSSYKNVSLNFGIQTFNSDILRKINRNYDCDYIVNLIKKTFCMNFRGLGIDLIANLPNYNLNTILSDIDIVAQLGIKHLAFYPLRIEPNSIFYNHYERFEQSFADCDSQRNIIDEGYSRLEDMGFSHYSIFHFDKDNKENYLYTRMQMNGEEWIGLGAGAYSFCNDQIFLNETDIRSYSKKCFSGISPVQGIIQLSKCEVIKRELVYSLRNRNVTKADYIKKYGLTIYNFIERIWQDLITYGYAIDAGDRFKLTTTGIMNLSEIEQMINEKYQI